MTARQLANNGPCHYHDRAVLSNSAHILSEQRSEGDEEHIEHPLHNTPDSIQQCSHLSPPALQSMPFSFNQFFYTPCNGWVIGITHSIYKELVSIRLSAALSVFSYSYLKSFLLCQVILII